MIYMAHFVSRLWLYAMKHFSVFLLNALISGGVLQLFSNYCRCDSCFHLMYITICSW